jgi:uncharacterized membrane protein (DUF4010 family)
MIAVGFTSTLVLTRGKNKGHLSSNKMNPLDLKACLKLALWLFSMLIIITLTVRYMGTQSGAFVSFLGGLSELHSISIATTTLYIQEKLSLSDARLLLSLALLGAFVSKFIIIIFLSRSRLSLLTSLFLLIMIIAGLISYFSLPIVF